MRDKARLIGWALFFAPIVYGVVYMMVVAR
jgi:hypothetical protein